MDLLEIETEFGKHILNLKNSGLEIPRIYKVADNNNLPIDLRVNIVTTLINLLNNKFKYEQHKKESVRSYLIPSFEEDTHEDFKSFKKSINDSQETNYRSKLKSLIDSLNNFACFVDEITR